MWLHVLDAAGDLHVLGVGGDALGGAVDGLQAGAAVAIDGDAANLDGQAGDEGGHARDVVALLALLLDAAPLNVLDRRRRHAGTLDQGAHQVRRQIVGPHIAEDALLGVSAANRRADGIDDNGMAHG